MVTAGKGRKEFGVPLCVSRHFPSSLCFSDLLMGHGVHCLGAPWSSLPACQCAR